MAMCQPAISDRRSLNTITCSSGVVDDFSPIIDGFPGFPFQFRVPPSLAAAGNSDPAIPLTMLEDRSPLMFTASVNQWLLYDEFMVRMHQGLVA